VISFNKNVPSPSRKTWDGVASTKPLRVDGGSAFVAAARFLGGQPFVSHSTDAILGWEERPSVSGQR
jgi:hypothetical protein